MRALQQREAARAKEFECGRRARSRVMKQHTLGLGLSGFGAGVGFGFGAQRLLGNVARGRGVRAAKMDPLDGAVDVRGRRRRRVIKGDRGGQLGGRRSGRRVGVRAGRVVCRHPRPRPRCVAHVLELLLLLRLLLPLLLRW